MSDNKKEKDAQDAQSLHESMSSVKHDQESYDEGMRMMQNAAKAKNKNT